MLRELIEEGKTYTIAPQTNVLKQPFLVNANICEDFLKWEMKALLYLQQEYGKISMVSDFKKSIDEDKKSCYIRTLYFQLGILEAFEKIQPKVVNTNSESMICGIIEHFNACAIQLRRRHAGRDTATANHPGRWR